MDGVTAVNGIDRVTMEMDEAMVALRRSMRGVPVRREGFTADHKGLARVLANLHTEMRWARLAAADTK
jgi:hypothetical protein